MKTRLRALYLALIVVASLAPVCTLAWMLAAAPTEADRLAVALRDWRDEAGGSMLMAQFARSASLAGGLTALALLLGVPAGFAVAREKFPGRRLMMLLCLVGVAVPAPLWLSFHLFARTLVESTDPVAAVVTVSFGMALPAVVLLSSAAMATIPDELLDLARLEGSSLAGQLLDVGLPCRWADVASVGAVLFGLLWSATLTQTVLLQSPSEMSLLAGQAILARRGLEGVPLAAFAVMVSLPGLVAQLAGLRRTLALAVRALVRLRSEF